MKGGGVTRVEGRVAAARDLRAIIEQFNLRRVYEWLLLAGLVGVAPRGPARRRAAGRRRRPPDRARRSA
jgi:hypothetical protein